jgi:uncharacterized protein (TIGR02145 family)
MTSKIRKNDIGLSDTIENSILVTDIDGNVYKTVQIGEQVWMAENLRVTKYRDGTSIPNVKDSEAWACSIEGAYCHPEHNVQYGKTYGALYNYDAVTDSRNIAPVGWHVPTDGEWKELEMYLGMSKSDSDRIGYGRGTNEGSKLAGNAKLWIEEFGETGSLESNSEFGSSGFNAVPGGGRLSINGTLHGMGYYAYFWSATQSNSDVWGRRVHYGVSEFLREDYYNWRDGCNVRLVKD